MINSMPEKVTLNAVVRGFGADHPDFETEALTYFKDESGQVQRDESGNLIKLTAVEPGIVAERLVNGKPVYNENSAQNRRQTTSGSAAFADWYSDDHPDKRELGFDFWMREGLYTFEDRAFFPLNPYGVPLWETLVTADSQGLTEVGQTLLGKLRAVHPDFGQGMSDLDALKQRYDNYQAKQQSYHFTLEAETSFIYQGDEEFAFFGDDDLWVFIDNKLVMDLGGLHPPAGCQDLAAARRQSDQKDAALVPGYLDLRSANPRNRSFSSNTLRLRLRNDLGIHQADEYLELVLMVGQSYTLKLFYAERHTFDANCCIYHTLRLPAADGASEMGTVQIPMGQPSWTQPARVGSATGVGQPLTSSPTTPANSLTGAGAATTPTGQWWVVAPTGSTSGSTGSMPSVIGGLDLNDPKLWDMGERIVCVAPVRTVVRREEEITLIRRVRKVEEVDASPACPINTVRVDDNQPQG